MNAHHKNEKRIVMIVAIALLGIVLCANLATGQAVKDLKRDRYLLLDSRIVESAENAKLSVGEVRKHEHNPLLGEDKPWEKRFDNLYANVIFDQEDRLYKCWYSPFIADNSSKSMTLHQRGEKSYRPPRGREMAICYAVSKDGIKWEKPDHWAGYEPVKSDQPASLTTGEISYPGQPLRITADVGQCGSIKVSVVDRNGKSISSAKPVTETVIDGELQWDPKISPGHMQLRFEISGAKLYSFSFASAA